MSSLLKSPGKSNGPKFPQNTWLDLVNMRQITPPPAFKNSLSPNYSSSERSDSLSPTPSSKSNHSSHSSGQRSSTHSDHHTTDSGVNSGVDSPPPHELDSLSTNGRTTSESEDDTSSDISEDSLHEEKDQKLESIEHYDLNIYENVPLSKLKTNQTINSNGKDSNPLIRPYQTNFPNPLLRQVCEKALEFQERRLNTNKNSAENCSAVNMLRGFPVKRSALPSKLLHSSSSSSSLLLSSVFSSTSSLYESDTIFEDHSLPQRPMSVCEEESPAGFLREDEDRNQPGGVFTGLHHIFIPAQKSAIMSQKGTVRGVRNRVRAGIATFTSDQRLLKIYKERERGLVVVFVTNLSIVRNTYERCQKIKKILWNLSVRFDERDVFMNRDTQIQLLDRLKTKVVSLPHVFIEGQYLGDADLIEQLNETGDLKSLLRQYRVPGKSTSPCDSCGGFRMLPCPACNGSKKSLNRNHFTQEFVALKCCLCDEAGLVRCDDCRGGV